MFRAFDCARWPNNMDFRAKGGLGSTEGLSRSSPAELERRHELVRRKLREMDCDLLMVQSHYQPSVMAINTKVAWLTGSNGYRNCVTLILPKDGTLVAVKGRKPSSTPGWMSPYTQGEDMSAHVKGAKRIAYAETAYLTCQFREYLMERAPGVEIVDFTNELEHMIAVKSREELALIEDTCQLQNRCWQAASAFLRPGRLVTEIRAEFHHMLLDLGMDPTLMPKILLFVRPNRPRQPEDGPHFKDRDYVLREDDYITVNFETPGSGGYYAERGRNFFFQEPHPRLRELWGQVLELHEFQMRQYRPGTTMVQLRTAIDAYKAERGFRTEGPIGAADPAADNTPEIRGMGLLTVDRPQIQLESQDLVLEPGVVFCTMPNVQIGHEDMKLFEMAVVGEDGAHAPAPYPLELNVL